MLFQMTFLGILFVPLVYWKFDLIRGVVVCVSRERVGKVYNVDLVVNHLPSLS